MENKKAQLQFKPRIHLRIEEVSYCNDYFFVILNYYVLSLIS